MDYVDAVPRCPLCQETGFRKYAEFPEFIWVRCSCGLIYKKFVSGVLADTAVGGEGSFGESGYGRRYDHRYRHRVGKSRHQLEDACAFLSAAAAAAPGSVLDIGCSLGYTLDAARQLGMAGTGVDVSQTAVDACRERGFVADVAGIDALPYADGAFSVVVMKHVLEHTRDPATALQEAKRVLKPGGVLFIAVPHAGYRKAVAHPASSRFYRPDAHGGVEHWIYYTPVTLARMLHGVGLQVTRAHPLLRHPQLSPVRRGVELLLYPLRRVWEGAATALQLRKEFWMVAIRAPAA